MQQYVIIAWGVIVFVVLPLVSKFLPNHGLIVLEVTAALTLAAIAANNRKESPAFQWNLMDTALSLMIAAWSLTLICHRPVFRGVLRLEEMIICFAAYRIFSSAAFFPARRIFWIVGAGVLLTATLSLLQYFDVFFLPWDLSLWSGDFGKRVFAGLGNPDWLGSFLVLTLPLVMAWYVISQQWPERLAAALAFAAGAAVLFLTESFAGWAGVIAGVAVFCVYAAAVKNTDAPFQRRLIQAMVMAAGVICFFVVTEIPEAGSHSRGFAERILRYRAAVEMIKSHPLSGVGLGNFPVRVDRYTAQALNEPKFKELWEGEQSVHPVARERVENEWLDIAAETGLFGFIFFLGWMLVIFKGAGARVAVIAGRSVDYGYLSAAALGALAGSLVDANFGFPWHIIPTAVIFFSLAGFSFLKEPSSGLRPAWPLATRVSIGILAICLLAMAASKAAGEYYLDQARDMKDHGRYPAAVSLLNTAKKYDPFDPQIDLGLGILWQVLQDYHAAERYLDRFIDQEPDHVLALYNRGMAREKTGNLKGALKDYRSAAIIKPRYAFLKIALARLENRTGDTSGAKKDLQEAAQLASSPAPSSEDDSSLNTTKFRGQTRDDRLVDMHFTRGGMYYAKGRLDLAAAEYRKVLVLDHRNADAISDIGVIYLQKGMFQRGAWQLRQALKMNPSHSGASQNLAAALKIMKAKGIEELPLTSNFADVPILVYHKVDTTAPTSSWVLDSDFKSQIDFLKKMSFETISLQDFVDARDGKKQLPARPVVIIFEGGFKDQLTDAVPVLKSHGFKASFFFDPSRMGSTGHLPDEPDNGPDTAFMTWKDARGLVKDGFEACVSSVDIGKSWDLLRRKLHLGRQPSFFFYPSMPVHLETISAVRQAGYKGAVIANGGLEELAGADMYLLHGIPVLGGDPSPGLVAFVTQVLPDMPLPDIAMTGPDVSDPLTQESLTRFKAGDKVRLKFSLRNLGDDVPTALKIRINAVNGGGVRMVFDEQYGTKKYPIQFGFETVRNVDMTIPLPADLPSGRLIFNFTVTSPDDKLEYFRTKDIPLGPVNKVGTE